MGDVGGGGHEILRFSSSKKFSRKVACRDPFLAPDVPGGGIITNRFAIRVFRDGLPENSVERKREIEFAGTKPFLAVSRWEEWGCELASGLGWK